MCLLRTGRGLASFTSQEVHAIGAHLFIEQSKRTEEEVKSRDATIGALRRIDRESEIGAPAVTEMYKPANEMYERR